MGLRLEVCGLRRMRFEGFVGFRGPGCTVSGFLGVGA